MKEAINAPSRLSFWLLLLASVMMYFDRRLSFTGRNLLVSDLLLMLSTSALVVDLRDRQQLTRAMRVNPCTLPFFVFSTVALLSLQIGVFTKSVVPEKTFFALLQLAFIFLFLAPLVFIHAQVFSRLVALWTVHWIMVAIAGLVSLTDYQGITHFWEQSYYRNENPLLGLNGFWLFGLISPFLLHNALQGFLNRRMNTAFGYLVLWGLGFIGMALTGVRVGFILAILSLVWVIWFYRPAVVHHLEVWIRLANVLILLILITSTVGFGTFVIRQFPVFELRMAIEGREFATFMTGRLNAIEAALSDFPSLIVVGYGFNQFREIHPEVGPGIHNHYLQVLYECGAFGLVAYLSLLLKLFKQTKLNYDQATKTGDSKFISFWHSALFSWIGFFIASMFYPIGFSRFDWILFLMAAGSVPTMDHALRSGSAYQRV